MFPFARVPFWVPIFDPQPCRIPKVWTASILGLAVEPRAHDHGDQMLKVASGGAFRQSKY